MGPFQKRTIIVAWDPGINRFGECESLCIPYVCGISVDGTLQWSHTSPPLTVDRSKREWIDEVPHASFFDRLLSFFIFVLSRNVSHSSLPAAIVIGGWCA